MNAIKYVRNETGLGLKEAKALVDDMDIAPPPVSRPSFDELVVMDFEKESA